jgi:hypothetical protein
VIALGCVALVCLTALVALRMGIKATEATHINESLAKALRDDLEATLKAVRQRVDNVEKYALDVADGNTKALSDVNARIDSWEKILPDVRALKLDYDARKMRGG